MHQASPYPSLAAVIIGVPSASRAIRTSPARPRTAIRVELGNDETEFSSNACDDGIKQQRHLTHA
jgi:hypothetical protein